MNSHWGFIEKQQRWPTFFILKYHSHTCPCSKSPFQLKIGLKLDVWQSFVYLQVFIKTTLINHYTGCFFRCTQMFFHAEFTIFIRSLISKYPVKLENIPDLVFLPNWNKLRIYTSFKCLLSDQKMDPVTLLHVFKSQNNFVKTIKKHRVLALICAVDHCNANGSEMREFLVDV